MQNRLFDKEDQEIIQAIYDASKDEPKALFEILRDSFFTDKALVYYKDSERIFFEYKAELSEGEKYRNELKKFWKLLTLIQFLVDESYISIMPYYVKKTSKAMFVWDGIDNTQVPQNADSYQLTPDVICKDYCFFKNGKIFLQGTELPNVYYKSMEIWFGDVFALKKLEELIHNNYITRDEKWHRQNLWWARGAVFAALLGVIATVVIA